ncbi:GumC family protein [Agrobacterium larrymoorei]|uniref:Exopolysaccharide transport family protein n=1 Tax=Agrobacterium larrymoorei TaxID=160699 RepID=A0AAF0HE65_9HYPH|nr:exopolysaccharide transport family protein [Agrobacterium larrymoorei]WHA42870.1 exopolysaccharide transport family protein [Agrobacterium larrymoorei]
MAMNQGVVAEAPYREPVHGPENLFRLVGLLWRNLLKIIAAGVLLALIAFGVSLLMPNYYTSTAQVLLDPEGSRVLESDLPGQPRAVDAHVLNQQYIMTSNDVLARVVESEKLYDDPAFGAADPGYPDRASRIQLAVFNLNKVTSVAVVGKSFVINITVRSKDPERAAQLANVIANTYIQVRSEMNADVLRRTGGGLSAQLDQLRKAVEDGDRAVQAYRAEHNLADIAGRPDSEQQIADANAEITRLSGTIAENEALVAELTRARTDRQYLRSIPDTSLTPAIISLRARYQQSQEEQSVLATSLGAQHPSLQAARARTQSLANILDEQLRNFATATSRNLDRLKNQLKLLTDNADALKRNLNGEESTMVQLRELQRKLDSDRAVYESFLLRTRQLSEQQGTSSENPRIISAAEAPLRKAGPPRGLITIGAGLFGMILAAGIIILRDQFGTPTRANVVPVTPVRDDITPVTPVDVAAAAPIAPVAAQVALARNSSNLVVRNEDSDALLAPAGDDYAGLARLLSASLPLAQNHSVLVVAAGPKNRAPYAAFNLAHAAARLGRRVLLADGAVADPVLTQLLLPVEKRGADAQGQVADFESTQLLKFLPAGHNDLLELLESSKAEPYDLVIIDGAVAGKNPVSSSLRKMIDDVVLVQHEEDSGSIVLALIALEESGLEQTRVVRQSRAGLQY